MDRIRIRGGRPLAGTIPVAGSKNAALPLLVASLLTDETLTLRNLPRLTDIGTLSKLLVQHGARLGHGEAAAGPGPGRTIGLTVDRIASTEAPYDLVCTMRASVLVMGPLVARAGEAKVSLPGGCAIGTRPVDLHLKALSQLGAEVELEGGYINLKAPKGLRGAPIVFPIVSVGATETALLAAALAKGETVITNAAREPEVAALARCLVAMGARIQGIGSDKIIVEGVPRLGGAIFDVPPDRIETGTYAAAAAITGGDLEILGARADELETVIQVFGQAGVEITPTPRGLRVRRPGPLVGADVMTEPYPGFPTDMQAQFMAMMSLADGAAMITETIFENRFMHVPELARMGARITVHGASALVRGIGRLTGAPVMATDLRASVSLIVAGLAAEGETVVNRVYHLDRGYERIEEKLAACGADIERLSGRA